MFEWQYKRNLVFEHNTKRDAISCSAILALFEIQGEIVGSDGIECPHYTLRKVSCSDVDDAEFERIALDVFHKWLFNYCMFEHFIMDCEDQIILSVYDVAEFYDVDTRCENALEYYLKGGLTGDRLDMIKFDNMLELLAKKLNLKGGDALGFVYDEADGYLETGKLPLVEKGKIGRYVKPSKRSYV